MITQQTLRQALRALDNERALGQSPLIALDCVRARKEFAQSPGLALRAVLKEAVEKLKPAGDERESGRQARSYTILRKQYLDGQARDAVSAQLFLERSAYHDAQLKALEALAGVLVRWEAATDETRAVDTSHEKRAPFLAPPRPPHRIVGRADVLGELKKSLLARETVALSAINGLPGVGKTALAIEIANDPEILAHFKDGVLWAGLGREPDVMATLRRWGYALGIDGGALAGHTTAAALAEMIHAEIGLRQMLLVIDDAWQSEAALAFRIGGPGTAQLLTTRSPKIAFDFAGSQTLSVKELSESSCEELIGQFAQQALAGSADGVRALIRQVGGLPLAVSLIGRHLGQPSVMRSQQRLDAAVAALANIEQRMRLTAFHSLLQRQPYEPATPADQSLKNVISLSYDELSQSAQRALYALSVLPPKPNTFTEEAALQIADATVEDIDALVDAGLLEVIGGRYTLHQTIADYGALHVAGLAGPQRMADYFMSFVEAHKTDYELIDADYANIFAAIDLAKRYSLSKPLARTVLALFPYVNARYFYRDTIALYDFASTVAKDDDDAQTFARLVNATGYMHMRLGDTEKAQQRFEDSLQAATNAGTDPELCAALRMLCDIERRKGDFARAQAFMTRCIGVARSLNDPNQLSLALTYKAALDVDVGDNKQAEASLLEAHRLERARNPNDPHRIAGICHMLGEVLRLSDAFEASDRYYTEGLAISRDVGIQSLIADILIKRVRVNLLKQDPAEALAEIKEGMDLAQSLGMPSIVTDGHLSLGMVKRQQGAFSEASQSILEALQISRTMQYPLDACECLENLVAVYVADGQLARAQEALLEFSNTAQPLSNKLVFAKLHMAAAGLAAVNDDFVQARREGEASLALFEEVGHRAKAEAARRWLAQLDGAGGIR